MFYRLLLKTRNAKDKAAEAKGEMVIFLHPTVHTVKADISGGMMNLVLEDAEHPFVKWAEQTKRRLQACTEIKQK